jgi:transcriptional regulator with AAA-type ATPase domain
MLAMDREVQFIGQSGAFLDAVERASRAAPMRRPVLVIGERGTGKELIAERLHRLSTRWQEPLVTMNCAALPETLIEAELFGHEAGAFTGATRARAGRFEEADKGTLFLDELGTLSMGAQERLLRAVEYGEVTRIGASRPIRVDVRIVAATNEDLPRMAAQGRFRPDLLDRLSFEVITLPRCACARATWRCWPTISAAAWPPNCSGTPGPALPPCPGADGKPCLARQRARTAQRGGARGLSLGRSRPADRPCPVRSV